MLQRMPSNVALPQAYATTLQQEILRFNSLLKLVHGTLMTLVKTLKGEEVMSSDSEEIYFALARNRVPTRWTSASYDTCKPLGSWLRDLVDRVRFFSEWAKLSKRQGVVKLPRSFWFSAFMFPQSFLTAVRQVRGGEWI